MDSGTVELQCSAYGISLDGEEEEKEKKVRKRRIDGRERKGETPTPLLAMEKATREERRSSNGTVGMLSMAPISRYVDTR